MGKTRISRAGVRAVARRSAERTLVDIVGLYNGLVRIAVLLVSLAGLVRAASPIHFEYACPEKDIDSFGLTCSERDPCAVFLELVSAESAGKAIFVVGNIHTQTTTLYAILLESQ